MAGNKKNPEEEQHSTPKRKVNAFEYLCIYDERNPNSEYLIMVDDEDKPKPRRDCACDNCFYGRDELALEIIRLQEVITHALKIAGNRSGAGQRIRRIVVALQSANRFRKVPHPHRARAQRQSDPRHLRETSDPDREDFVERSE